MATRGRTQKNHRTKKTGRTLPRLSRERLMQGVETAVGFCLGTVLSGAELFGLYAPFGVAATAAAGSGITGFSTMAGACLGYLCLEGITDGMRYAASAVLTYSVAFAFYDTRLYRRIWFMPAIAMILSALTGMICRGGQGWYGQDLVYFVTEVLLTGTAALCYRVIYACWPETMEQFRSLSPRQSAGILMLAGTVLMSLGRVELLHTVSLGRLLAAAAVQSAARLGIGPGVLTGACAGCALDLTSVGVPGCSLLYSLAGLTCGLCRGRKKPAAALVYCLTAAFAVLWLREDTSGAGMFLETAAGTALFLLLPQPLWLRPESGPGKRAAESTRIQTRLIRSAAEAVHALRTAMEEALDPDASSPDDPAAIFSRTADRICRGCVLYASCWQKNYESTRSVLNAATGPALDRGRALATDFAGHFSARCVRFPSFLGEVNRQLTAFLRRRQTLRRTREIRSTLVSQYAQLDRLFAQASEAAAALTPDGPRQEALEQWLRSRDLSGGAVYLDPAGHLHVETPASAALRETAARRELSRLLGIPLTEGIPLRDHLHFSQAAPLQAKAAMASAARRQETVNGDTGLWFRRPDGMLFLLLCDGMGSGPRARRESAQTAELIRRFLQAGMEPAQTLETVSSALSLRGEAGGSTCVDLLAADLFTGACCIYKQGAAPSYVRRGTRLRCAAGASLPSGLSAGAEARPHAHSFQGQAGDWVVLLSDGILCGRNDGWLKTLLETAEPSEPQQLADSILSVSQRETDREDDSTVLVLYLEQAVF